MSSANLQEILKMPGGRIQSNMNALSFLKPPESNHEVNIMKLLSVFVLCGALFVGPKTSQAATMTLEQKYQDVFVSAGYATALGAAVGAALLAFKEDPSEHLRYVAIGASVGFFAGTTFGTYLAVAPAFSSHDKTGSKYIDYAGTGLQERQLLVQPVIDQDTWTLSGAQAGMVLAKF